MNLTFQKTAGSIITKPKSVVSLSIFELAHMSVIVILADNWSLQKASIVPDSTWRQKIYEALLDSFD